MRQTSWKARGALALVLLAAAACSCAGMSQFLKAYGYVELRPPSTLLAPGAMVAVVSRQPYVAKIICGPRASMGADWAPMESRTELPSYTRKRDTTFGMDLDVLNQIRSHTEYSGIEDITITLQNARIVEISDEDVYNNLFKRSWQCKQAIEARREAGFDVTMVSSGLMGDVTYSIKWSRSFKTSNEAKVAAMKDLAITLGGGSSFVDERTIKASGLTWGIKDDRFLAALSLSDTTPSEVPRGSRLITPEEVEGFDLSPDAPVVTPCIDAGPVQKGEAHQPPMHKVEGALPAQPVRVREGKKASERKSARF